jgi:hypothetical protein
VRPLIPYLALSWALSWSLGTVGGWLVALLLSGCSPGLSWVPLGRLLGFLLESLGRVLGLSRASLDSLLGLSWLSWGSFGSVFAFSWASLGSALSLLCRVLRLLKQ